MSSRFFYLTFILLLVSFIPAGFCQETDTELDTLALMPRYREALDFEAVQELFRREVMPGLITETEMRDFYEHDRWQVEAAHILITVDMPEAEASAIALMNKLYEKITSGEESFTDVAHGHNEDESTPDGYIGWISWGSMVPLFEQVVWDMEPGEVSLPFRTTYGWHIAKTINKRERPNYGSFEEERHRVETRLARLHQGELDQASEYYIERLKDERGYSVHRDNIEAIHTAAALADARRTLPEQLSEDMNSLPLVSCDDGALSVTIVEMYELAPDADLLEAALDDPNMLQDAAETVLRDYLLLPDEARKQGCYDDPEVIRRARIAAGLPVDSQDGQDSN